MSSPELPKNHTVSLTDLRELTQKGLVFQRADLTRVDKTLKRIEGIEASVHLAIIGPSPYIRESKFRSFSENDNLLSRNNVPSLTGQREFGF